jgi:hypothetical protein
MLYRVSPLLKFYGEFRYDGCRYDECRYADCRGAVMLCMVRPSIMPSSQVKFETKIIFFFLFFFIKSDFQLTPKKISPRLQNFAESEFLQKKQVFAASIHIPFWPRHDGQNNGIQHNDTQHKNKKCEHEHQ